MQALREGEKRHCECKMLKEDIRGGGKNIHAKYYQRIPGIIWAVNRAIGDEGTVVVVEVTDGSLTVLGFWWILNPILNYFSYNHEG